MQVIEGHKSGGTSHLLVRAVGDTHAFLPSLEEHFYPSAIKRNQYFNRKSASVENADIISSDLIETCANRLSK